MNQCETFSSGTLRVVRRAVLAGSALALTACASIGIGVSVPLPGMGGVGVGVDSSGRVGGGVSIGTGGARVGVGGSAQLPERRDTEKDKTSASPGAAGTTNPPASSTAPGGT
jgi:hypothetical protein